MNNIKERPILFTAPMVNAILDGRKTQTRRVMKYQPCALNNGKPDGYYSISTPKNIYRSRKANGFIGFIDLCPYGKKGDRIWVRETWGLIGRSANSRLSDFNDPEIALKEHLIFRSNCDGYDKSVQNWRSSIHMPRWASRINLDITGIRVERLQDISQADAIAEGLKAITKDGSLVKHGIPDNDGLPGTDDNGWPWRDFDVNPVNAYRKLWESINGQGSWEANPWVWVIEFRRI